MADERSEGVIATWWTATAIPFELCWHGILVTAEYSWHPGKFLKEEFDPKFSNQFYGMKDAKIVEAMYLLEGKEIPYAQSYFSEGTIEEKIEKFEGLKERGGILRELKNRKEKSFQALELFNGCRGKITRNELRLRHLLLAAKTIIHKINQVLIFHELRSEHKKSLKTKKQLENLKQELLSAKEETKDVFRISMQSLAVAEEILMHYGEEERKINEYLQTYES
ncbi:hypothetical protein ES708_29985 [subsurface metagenome]